MRARSLTLLTAVALGLSGGCASVLGVDGEFDLEEPGGGGGQGGALSAGGSLGGTSPGGVPVVGGGGWSAGGVGTGGGVPPGPDAEAPCSPGQKLCPIADVPLCVAPDPSVGCDLIGCDQCVAPPGGYSICNGAACSFECFAGSVRNGDTCELLPPSDGGGTGGRPGSCTSASDCPPCGSVPACCTVLPQGRCGCNFVWCVPA